MQFIFGIFARNKLFKNGSETSFLLCEITRQETHSQKFIFAKLTTNGKKGEN